MIVQHQSREFGITALGDFILSEGVEAVVERLADTGITAVACNPTVTAPSAENEGTFQPPADAGTSPRLFDRQLFGQHALWVRSGPSFVPNPSLYDDNDYRPRTPNELTDQHGHLITRFIDQCHRHGMKVFFQIGAAQPSGLRDEDRPRLPNGLIASNRMADTGSLASQSIRNYNRAYLRDLLQNYPEIDGIRIDWPEYPCYTWGEIFQDFGPHVAHFARKKGFDFDAIRNDVHGLFNVINGQLTNTRLEVFADPLAAHTLFGWTNVAHGHILEWLRLKAELSRDLILAWRSALDEAGGSQMELIAHAFMTPYSNLTGFDFTAASRIADCISPKFYTMHWSLMIEFWGRSLLQANPGLNEQLVVRCLQSFMQLEHPSLSEPTIADFGYPAPDEPHPISSNCQSMRIEQLIEMTRFGKGSARMVPLVHGYGPLDDFRKRLAIVAQSHADGFWINRYGYLSDEKLSVVKQLVNDH